jgi:hypothetical protein
LVSKIKEYLLTIKKGMKGAIVKKYYNYILKHGKLFRKHVSKSEGEKLIEKYG